jgi:hypothetical protein
VQDRRIRRSYGVKDITADNDHVWAYLDDPVDRLPESGRHISLTLIESAFRLPLVLPEPEVEIGYVDQLH